MPVTQGKMEGQHFSTKLFYAMCFKYLLQEYGNFSLLLTTETNTQKVVSRGISYTVKNYRCTVSKLPMVPKTFALQIITL